jgi:hypothetical protein
MTCGSTSSCRSAKSFTSTAFSSGSSGASMVASGSARNRERRSGSAMSNSPGAWRDVTSTVKPFSRVRFSRWNSTL